MKRITVKGFPDVARAVEDLKTQTGLIDVPTLRVTVPVQDALCVQKRFRVTMVYRKKFAKFFCWT